MRLSADVYFDDTNLMDIQVMGSMGLTDIDVEAIRAVDGVAKAEAAYSKDVLCEEEGSQKVLHVMTMPETMNQVDIVKGRLPETEDECLIDADFLKESSYEVGDQITFISGNEDELTDSLKQETFTIVGSGTMSYYISYTRGSSTVGNGSISGFAAVTSEAFTLEVYTEIYIAAEDAEKETAFTSGYDDKIDIVIDNVEAITDERCEIRRVDIVDEAQQELNDARQEFEDEKAKADKEIAEAQEELDDAKRQINDAKAELTDGWKQLEDGQNELIKQENELNIKIEEYNDGVKAFQQGEAELEAAEKEYQEQSAGARTQIAAAEKELQSVKDQLDALKVQYDAIMSNPAATAEQLAAAQAILEQWEAGTAELKTQTAALEKQKGELSAAEAQLTDARTELETQGKTLQKAAAQLENGKKQIASAWSEIEENEKLLRESQALLDEKEQELEDGRKEFEEKKQEADEEIAKAEKKLLDAEDEISKIEEAKWYVQDRGSVLPEYSGYGDNADRMRAIGQVFPVLFFLVAALISLTTMTRMVEEQRTQIGTMKALGYGKLPIAGKYMNYALLATLGGSIVGVLIGEKLFPYIIVTAYQMMYEHIPSVLVPYHLSYAVMATAAALVCTLGATWFACYKELRAQPAVLMRPPTPMLGKRVLIERIPLLWRRLTFIWKSTIRNLFRYKKRFFMTVLGIGGCMALMIVGFGLQDSIFEIAEMQYEELEHADATVYLKDDLSNAERQELNDYIAEEAAIAVTSEMYVKSMTLKSEESKSDDVYMYVLNEADEIGEFLTFRDRIGREEYNLPADGVILTEKMADTLEVSVGDTLTIVDKDKGNKEVTIRYICENYMGHNLYMSTELYESLYQRSPYYNGIWMKMSDYDEQKLEAIGEEMLSGDAALSVRYMTDIRAQVDDMLTSLDLVIVVLIISAGMLAFVVLYNLNNINITERKRELATIKVLGFYDGEVAAYVFRENILLTLIGISSGLVLGKLLHQFVIVTVEIDNVMFGRNVKFISYGISSLLTLGFSAFVNFVMYFKLKTIDMIESLKSVE